MKKQFISLIALSFATVLTPTYSLADGPIAVKSQAEESAKFQQDRSEILGMAGNYNVRFDMQETTPWIKDYTPLERKKSGGYETVKIIEDTGSKIVLQHLLVVDTEDNKQFIIKHWRQDWQYEPKEMLVYRGKGIWEFEKISEKMAKGRWSQTVYQVDDSPRYAGFGQFETQAGIKRWRSNWTLRPLARRDAVRKPIYDRYLSINRHQLTPNGWIHWQDNTKMGEIDGKLTAIVQESVLNTYTKFDGYNVKAADEYWDKTKDYWEYVRELWEENARKNNGIRVQEKAETGTVISAELLQAADDIIDGKISIKKAKEKANSLISKL